MSQYRITPRLPFTVLEIAGPDSAAFLLSQLTNQLPDPGQHQLQGYCSAKGRLLAIFRLWSPAADRHLAIIPTELADQTAKRLRLFVLRAKVTITLADLSVRGLWGPDMPAGGNVTSPAPEAFLLGLAPAGSCGHARAWLVGEVPEEAQIAPDATVASEAQWMAAEIEAGLPWVWLASLDTFVPQMLNLELVGGVSFTKGCYPGQEVVARSHYLGKLKKRMFVVDILGAPPVVGSDLLDQDGVSQGEVVMAASVGDTSKALISVQLEAWKSGGLTAAASGAAIEAPPEQPYAVPLEPQAPNRPKL